uniref:Uncharacterized protein n=1 Tax=Anguilla anguilla TaxID=7936 RepID=A0A0E9QPD2_ANGAN
MKGQRSEERRFYCHKRGGRERHIYPYNRVEWRGGMEGGRRED